MLYRKLLNYPGSKARLLDYILPRVPQDKTIYVEPFLGSGTVWLNVRDTFDHYHIGDQMFFVSHVWKVILSDEARFQAMCDHARKVTLAWTFKPPAYVVKALKEGMVNLADQAVIDACKADYYGFRQLWNQRRLESAYRDGDMALRDEVAVELIILAGACINSLVRFGKEGAFNQGWGCRKFDAGLLLKAREWTQGKQAKTTIWAGWHFKKQMESTRPLWPQAFFYFDPPYGGRSEADVNGLYSLDEGWTAADDQLLADYCQQVHSAGGKFLLSNLQENERLVHALQAFQLTRLPDVKYKSSPGKHARRQQTEVLISNDSYLGQPT